MPTSVLEARRDDGGAPHIEHLEFPSHLIGGGYPVLTDTQGQQKMGSVACLVTDGSQVFALTSQHVVGEPETNVFTVLGGRDVRLGSSHSRSVGKVPFDQAYPGRPGFRAFSHVDAGLLRLEDVSVWTAQVYGIGEMGEPLDLGVDSIDLDLIGRPVRTIPGLSGSGMRRMTAGASERGGGAPGELVGGPAAATHAPRFVPWRCSGVGTASSRRAAAARPSSPWPSSGKARG